MKPSGWESRKKSRSTCVSAGPEQPKTTARGSRLDKDAPNAPPLQLAAVPLDRRRIGDRPGLNADAHGAHGHIGARRGESHGTAAIALLAPPARPLPPRRLRRAHRIE